MFYLEIVNAKSGEVVKQMGPMSQRKAEKTQIGVMINLNHDEYYTRLVPAVVSVVRPQQQ